MLNISKVLFLITFLILASCTSDKIAKDEIVEKDLESQMIEVYKEGLKSLEEGDNLYAAKKFNEAEILYPQSTWAPQSLLMASYAFYEINFLQQAIDELDRFIITYTDHEHVSYAYFLRAMCYFEMVVDEKKDGGYITPVEAEDKFETFISRIRLDDSQPNTINLWIVSDNLLKGAALNAVQTAEALIKNDFYGQ